MSGEEEGGSVPLWAVTLRESIARIDERTQRIDGIADSVETLRRTTVPLNEHELLMQRVDQLWNRDLQARGAWEELMTQVPTLWEERTQRVGVTRWQNRALAIMGAVVTLLSVATLLQGLGLGVHFTSHP